MAKFSNERKGGKNYSVKISSGSKHSKPFATIIVKALDVRRARSEAILEATRRNLVIDPTLLVVHSLTRA